jgi:hypothetical protein
MNINRASNYSLMALLFFTLSVVTISCQKDEDKITPSNPSSANQDADKLVGIWRVNENSQIFGQTVFEVEIVKTGANLVSIRNFYNLGFTHAVSATISGTGIQIGTQTTAGQTISGTGAMSNATNLTMTYTANDGTGNDNCSAIFVKQ